MSVLLPAAVLCAAIGVSAIAAIRSGANRKEKSSGHYGPSDVYIGIFALAVSLVSLYGLWVRW